MEIPEGPSHTPHRQPRYMAIFWWLLALTILEVLASMKLPLGEGPKIVLLVSMAIVKALLVALYFMHLKYERLSLGVTVSLTLVLALILVSANLMQWFFHSPSTVMPPH
jgi:cytochrome c oxidase subunit 4